MRDALDAGIPWVPHRARGWLESVVEPSWAIFEYGAGGSTVFFAERAQRVVSVEHDAEWADRTRARVGSASHVTVHLVTSEAPPPGADVDGYGPQHFTSRAAEGRYRGRWFESYARMIEREEALFDLVLVDGRSRPACTRLARTRVRPGGWVVLDNTDKPRYASTLDLMSDLERIDLEGAGPFDPSPWRTTAWRVT